MSRTNIQQYQQLERTAMYDLPVEKYENLDQAKKKAIDRARKELNTRQAQRTEMLEDEANHMSLKY